MTKKEQLIQILHDAINDEQYGIYVKVLVNGEIMYGIITGNVVKYVKNNVAQGFDTLRSFSDELKTKSGTKILKVFKHSSLGDTLLNDISYIINNKHGVECVLNNETITYEDIVKELFKNKTAYYISSDNVKMFCTDCYSFNDVNNLYSIKQGEKLIALTKLINVAKYLNGDWKPDFEKSKCAYFIEEHYDNIKIVNYCCLNSGTPCFKSEELAKQAIDILGEEIIRIALSQV